jgi:hypothetical protein
MNATSPVTVLPQLEKTLVIEFNLLKNSTLSNHYGNSLNQTRPEFHPWAKYFGQR